MNNADAERQIAQMIQFIKQEAREKAEEIQVRTEAEFNAKKLNLVAQARHDLKEDYQKKRKEALSKKRIARSRMINNSHFETMRERDAIIKHVKEDVRKELNTVSSNAKYGDLIRALIIQGLSTVMENHVEVRCREEDLKVVEAQIKPSLKEFKELMKAECGIEPQCELVLNKENFLAPAPSDDNAGVSCTGGVVLTARAGKIVVRNTLDHRLDLSFQQLLPVTREIVFGKRAAAVAAKPASTSGHH
jgi:V-type H+-transporting ATPase subunit E